MKHVKLGDLEVARIGLGAMGMSHGLTGAGTGDAESIRTVHRAIDLGVTLIDTAEIYGPYINEELLGQALKGHRTKSFWRPSSASSPTPGPACGRWTPARPTSAPRSKDR